MRKGNFLVQDEWEVGVWPGWSRSNLQKVGVVMRKEGEEVNGIFFSLYLIEKKSNLFPRKI